MPTDISASGASRMSDESSTLKSQPSAPVHQPDPLIHFENARRELELARTVDEVKQIRDKAEAMRLYCKQALHSLEMQNQCAEIKLRAERRAGEMLSETEKNLGGQVEHESYLSYEGTGRIPKLSDLGISRNQSAKWQKISEIPEESFEEFIETTKSREKELTSSGALLLAREIQRQRVIADLKRTIEKTPSIPHQKYDVIVIDPAWRYELRQGQTGRRNTTPYPTMSIEEIKALPVQTIAAEDAILWLWTTNTHLPDAFDVVREWGFQYKVLLTWVKNRLGTGHWLRGRTEHCLMAVKGRPVTKSHASEYGHPRSCQGAFAETRRVLPAGGNVVSWEENRTVCKRKPRRLGYVADTSRCFTICSVMRRKAFQSSPTRNALWGNFLQSEFSVRAECFVSHFALRSLRNSGNISSTSRRYASQMPVITTSP